MQEPTGKVKSFFSHTANLMSYFMNTTLSLFLLTYIY